MLQRKKNPIEIRNTRNGVPMSMGVSSVSVPTEVRDDQPQEDPMYISLPTLSRNCNVLARISIPISEQSAVAEHPHIQEMQQHRTRQGHSRRLQAAPIRTAPGSHGAGAL